MSDIIRYASYLVITAVKITYRCTIHVA